MVFPESIGRFQRVQVTEFAPGQKNIGVGYNLYDPENPIIMTVYVRPAPTVINIGSPPEVVAIASQHLFARALETEKASIMNAHPNARLISDGAFVLTEAGRKHEGHESIFEFQYTFWGTPEDAFSRLYLFRHNDWFIKYRITSSKGAEESAKKAISSFMTDLHWPEE